MIAVQSYFRDDNKIEKVHIISQRVRLKNTFVRIELISADRYLSDSSHHLSANI